MTRSEALAYFKEELEDGKRSDTCSICNANEWAIKALEEVDAIYERANQKALDELPLPTLTTAGEPIFVTGMSIEPIWHPYPEEKPSEEGEYLVTESSCVTKEVLFVAVEYYSGDNWTDENNCRVWDISRYIRAWMPMPEPYNKEKTDAQRRVEDNGHNENQ